MSKYNSLSDDSRVWIYQSKNEFSDAQVEEIKIDLKQFTESWVSHNNALRAHGEVRHKRFIVLLVDESQAGASGCSIDKSVRFIQAIEQKFGLDLFDRMTFTYLQNEKVLAADRNTFGQLFSNNIINENTQVFDNLIKTKKDLDNNWVKKLGESWHARMV